MPLLCFPPFDLSALLLALILKENLIKINHLKQKNQEKEKQEYKQKNKRRNS